MQLKLEADTTGATPLSPYPALYELVFAPSSRTWWKPWTWFGGRTKSMTFKGSVLSLEGSEERRVITMDMLGIPTWKG